MDQNWQSRSANLKKVVTCFTRSVFLCPKGDRWIQVWLYSIYIVAVGSLRVNPIARIPGQIKLDSDKWKIWQNLFEWIEFFF